MCLPLLLSFALPTSRVLVAERGESDDSAMLAEAFDARVMIVVDEERDTAKQAIKEGKALLAAADEMAFAMKTDAAIAKINEAKIAFARGMIAEDDLVDLAECDIHLGAAWMLKGKPALADEAFWRAAILQAGATVNLDQFNPQVLARFTSITHEVERAPTGGLAIAGQPEGAVVKVDGHRVGALPVTVSALAGSHWIQVEAKGFSGYASAVVVPEGKTASAEVFLRTLAASETLRAIDQDSPSEEDVRAARRLSQRESAGAVLLLDRDRQHARVFDARTDTYSPRLSGSTLALAAQVDTFLAPSPAVPARLVPRAKPVPVALSWLPLGVGQNLEGRVAPWLGFMCSEILFLAANVISGIVFFSDRLPDGTFVDARRDRALQIVNLATLGALVADVVVGGVDGLVHRAPVGAP